jgi:hypothetical protein
LLQELHWIRQIHENPAADHSVEVAVQLQIGQGAGLEGNSRPPSCAGPITGDGKDFLVRIDADDAALRADKVGQNKRDVSRTTVQIEHLHSGGDARGGQELPGERTVRWCWMIKRSVSAVDLPKA